MGTRLGATGLIDSGNSKAGTLSHWVGHIWFLVKVKHVKATFVILDLMMQVSVIIIFLPHRALRKISEIMM